MIRLSIPSAIASILGRKDHEAYRSIGQSMKINDLYKLLGLKGSPMLYHYMSGKTPTIEPERALVILEKFDILIDLWIDEAELRQDATDTELSLQIAREPIKKIIDELVEVDSLSDHHKVIRGIRKLIAKYY